MCELCDSEFDEDESLMDDKRWKNYGTPAKRKAFRFPKVFSSFNFSSNMTLSTT